MGGHNLKVNYANYTTHQTCKLKALLFQKINFSELDDILQTEEVTGKIRKYLYNTRNMSYQTAHIQPQTRQSQNDRFIYFDGGGGGLMAVAENNTQC
jgi:hypothetical protein